MGMQGCRVAEWQGYFATLHPCCFLRLTQGLPDDAEGWTLAGQQRFAAEQFSRAPQKEHGRYQTT